MFEWSDNLTYQPGDIPLQIASFAAFVFVFAAIGGCGGVLLDLMTGRHTGRGANCGRKRPGSEQPDTYLVERHLASGDLSNVYRAVQNGRSCILKVPREPDVDRMLLKEQRVLRQLFDADGGDTYAKYLPRPVETFISQQRQLVSVFEDRQGVFTAEDIRRQFADGVEARHLAWMLNRTLEVLGFVHSQGWVHGAVLPCHLLFDVENHGLQLAGWTHAERIGQRLKSGSTKYRRWYPPECLRRQPVTPSVDIYLAAKSIISLAGGDPATNSIPKHLPGGFRRFLKSCVLDSVRMRPQDAWELRDDLADVLESIYGPPRFHAFPVNQLAASV